MARNNCRVAFPGKMTSWKDRLARQGVSASDSSADRRELASHPSSGRSYGIILAKSTIVPTTDLSFVGPTRTVSMASISRPIRCQSTPSRRNLSAIRPGKRSGEGPDCSCRREHCQERQSTHHQQERLIDNHPIQSLWRARSGGQKETWPKVA